MVARTPLLVGVIGFGAIGGTVASALRENQVAGCDLSGTLTRGSDAPLGVASLDALLERSELIVEAAGQAAVAEYGPSVITSGRDLLLVSVGALVDAELRVALAAGPGRAEVSSGAIGGFDALRAAVADGGLDHVELTTTKPPGSLSEAWMDADLRARLTAGDERIEVFDGSAAEAVDRFPRSVNVAATLALATLGFERTRVRVVADPAEQVNEHAVHATGAAGTYDLRFRNAASPDNPRTSGLTAKAVLRRLGDHAAPLIVGT